MGILPILFSLSTIWHLTYKNLSKSGFLLKVFWFTPIWGTDWYKFRGWAVTECTGLKGVVTKRRWKRESLAAGSKVVKNLDSGWTWRTIFYILKEKRGIIKQHIRVQRRSKFLNYYIFKKIVRAQIPSLQFFRRDTLQFLT